jgi:hypothetical protein
MFEVLGMKLLVATHGGAKCLRQYPSSPCRLALPLRVNRVAVSQRMMGY